MRSSVHPDGARRVPALPAVRWCLRHVPLFQSFPAATVARLHRLGTRRDLGRGASVFLDGDGSDRVYFACGGRVRSTMISSGGKVVTLAHYGPGEIFGEACLSSDAPRQHSVWTTTPAIIAELPVAPFRDALRDSPATLLALSRILNHRHQALSRRLGDLVLRDVTANLAGHLLDLAKDFGREADGPLIGTVIDIERTQAELANDIASTRETVSSTLARFHRDGLVAKQGRRLVVIDSERLRVIASDSPGSPPSRSVGRSWGGA